MKIKTSFLLAATLFSSFLFAQSTRPSATALTSFNTKQYKLTALTSAGFSYRPTSPSSNNPSSDVYMGDNTGTGWTLSIGTITGNTVVTLQDSTGFLIGSAWVFTATANANTTQPLSSLNGVWLQSGFKLSCTDSTSGTNCALIEAQLIWRE